MKEIEADALLALANVERAHDRAVESCTTNATILPSEGEGAGQMVPYRPPPEQAEPEPERDEAAETAKLAAHQQAAMKIKAQHAPLGHSPEDKLKRRAIEHEMARSEQQHNE